MVIIKKVSNTKAELRPTKTFMGVNLKEIFSSKDSSLIITNLYL
jgi:hypothetical protein